MLITAQKQTKSFLQGNTNTKEYQTGFEIIQTNESLESIQCQNKVLNASDEADPHQTSNVDRLIINTKDNKDK